MKPGVPVVRESSRLQWQAGSSSSLTVFVGYYIARYLVIRCPYVLSNNTLICSYYLLFDLDGIF